ncbi:Mitochondrial calcium uniporter regulator 1, partial [Manis javanica]
MTRRPLCSCEGEILGSGRVYYSTSRNHCICVGQDHGGQHGHRVQRHGHQGAAENKTRTTSGKQQVMDEMIKVQTDTKVDFNLEKSRVKELVYYFT